MASQNDSKIIKDLGMTLKKARLRAQLTQAEVADLVEVHSNYYARIERDELVPSLELLRGIMKVLNIKSLNILA